MLALVITMALMIVVLGVILVVRERNAAAYRAQYTSTSADVDAARFPAVAPLRFLD